MNITPMEKELMRNELEEGLKKASKRLQEEIDQSIVDEYFLLEKQMIENHLPKKLFKI